MVGNITPSWADKTEQNLGRILSAPDNTSIVINPLIDADLTCKQQIYLLACAKVHKAVIIRKKLLYHLYLYYIKKVAH